MEGIRAMQGNCTGWYALKEANILIYRQFCNEFRLKAFRNDSFFTYIIFIQNPLRLLHKNMIQLLFQGQIALFVLILFSLTLSLTFHEYGHGIMAKYFGDNTAEKQGRLTLNPIVHIDPMGLLMLIIIGFGFAKPVPTNPRNFNSRWGLFFVAAAGPFMNLILAFVTINIYGLGVTMGVSLFEGPAASTFFILLASINMILMLFNLIPIGPLDGHYLLPYFLPHKLASKYIVYNQKYGHWALLSVVVLAIMGVPVFNFVWEFGQTILQLIILV